MEKKPAPVTLGGYLNPELATWEEKERKRLAALKREQRKAEVNSSPWCVITYNARGGIAAVHTNKSETNKSETEDASRSPSSRR